MKLNGYEGFLFLFNPNYKQINRTILFDGKLNLKIPKVEKGWLLVIERNLSTRKIYYILIDYNQTIEHFLLDGQSVTVYQLMFIQYHQLFINQYLLELVEKLF